MKRPIFFTSFFSTKFSGIEVLDLGRDLAGELGSVEVRDAAHAALAGQQILPDFLRGVSHAADQADAR